MGYPTRYKIPDQDVPVLIEILCLDIRRDWHYVVQVRKRYCMLLELAIRYGDKKVLAHILEFHVESRDDGRWLRDVYEGEEDDDSDAMIKSDMKHELLSEESKRLIADYCTNYEDWTKS